MLADKEVIAVTYEGKEEVKLEVLLDEKGISNRKKREFFKRKAVQVNGKYRRRSYRVKPGAKIIFVLDGESNDYLLSENIPDIIYESDHFVVVNKPSGQVMYEQVDQGNSLANDIATYYNRKDLKRKIHFVNRLDRDTSGLVLVAKHELAHGYMASQWDEDVEKYYIGLTKKHIGEAGIIEKPISYDENQKKYRVDEQGKESRTVYRLLETKGNYHVYELELKSGRTHQIRVHLTDLEAPLIGDAWYGETETAEFYRVALHASRLIFKEFWTERTIDASSPLPKDIKALMT